MALHEPGNATSTDNADDLGAPVRQLDGLLRGEMSATETYRQAIDKLNDMAGGLPAETGNLLREMQEDHVRAAQLLRERIQSLGGEPSDTPGARGVVAQGVQATMNLFGDSSALAGLRHSEESALKNCESAADELDAASAGLLRAQLVPCYQRHINYLDRMIEVIRQAGSVGGRY